MHSVLEYSLRYEHSMGDSTINSGNYAQGIYVCIEYIVVYEYSVWVRIHSVYYASGTLYHVDMARLKGAGSFNG